MIREGERERAKVSEKKRKVEEEKERKLSLFQRFKTNHAMYTYVEHCLLTILYFSASVFAYFL